ncbi:expressed unknown protein [Seminavis robusta]|uniref:Uncharacterized protein n=1 Tax=Seminavis robusta TaxID=568900 RepID=A0A9N8EYC5_9STRA|nr:expressed unknown protein [Seminavis robusta]|eukprot:Sro2106_g314820.1 n/a (272) ;mRNA; f:14200-15015
MSAAVAAPSKVVEQVTPGVIEKVDMEEEAKEEAPERAKIEEAISSSDDSAKTKIRFGLIRIRTYATIIGDNPSPSMGPPIQMDWKPLEQKVLCVDEYEEHREPRRENFLLAGGTRAALLKDLGFTAAQIEEAVLTARTVRSLRRQTVNNLRWDWKEEKKEERQDYIRRVFFCRPEKVLEYPDVRVQKDEYWDETNKVKPMFDHIPCTHCSSFVCAGPASDFPAMVWMLRCDGKQCQTMDKGDATCPFTGKPKAELMKEFLEYESKYTSTDV